MVGSVIAFFCASASVSSSMGFRAAVDTAKKPVPHIAIKAGISFIRLSLPEAWNQSEPSALLEVNESVENSSAVTAEQRAQNWDAEAQYFLSQTAVRQVWSHSVVVYPTSGKPLSQVNTIRNMLIPGLQRVRFRDVFGFLAMRGCPLWIIGGSVRDVLADKQPNDVDLAALCDVQRLSAILQGSPYDKKTVSQQGYFSVGEAHGANPNYLEGFTMNFVFEKAFVPESSVNMLLWSLTYDYVIDASGHGVEDAMRKLYRPGSPDVQSIVESSQWASWREWIWFSFASPQFQRHVRYLKMRSRGWQAANPCVRLFMADLIAAMAHVENMDVASPEIARFLGQEWPAGPAATLLLFVSNLGTKEPNERRQFVHQYLDAMREDLTFYFQADRNQFGDCVSDSFPLVKDKAGFRTRSPFSVLQALFETCKAPSKAVQKELKSVPQQFVKELCFYMYEKISGKSGNTARPFPTGFELQVPDLATLTADLFSGVRQLIQPGRQTYANVRRNMELKKVLPTG
eukprot:TRINITY_DN22781_c0_g1_i1.p1 TRINITY_DN22781_c0_g1~~TRINITY_DN22781_c0_g1_i1.p1  ORF type:complete len:514 (-),score=54.46 TRINITY_DN22781_c0_g1_i1:8-1549(-)